MLYSLWSQVIPFPYNLSQVTSGKCISQQELLIEDDLFFQVRDGIVLFNLLATRFQFIYQCKVPKKLYISNM